MTSLSVDLETDLSQNPVLRYMMSGQQIDTTDTPNADEFIDAVFPIELFPRAESNRKNYGLPPYVMESFLSEEMAEEVEKEKENEWVRLVGFDFYSLSEEKKRFLLQTAGIFKFETKIDIKKLYDTSIY